MCCTGSSSNSECHPHQGLERCTASRKASPAARRCPLLKRNCGLCPSPTTKFREPRTFPPKSDSISVQSACGRNRLYSSLSKGITVSNCSIRISFATVFAAASICRPASTARSTALSFAASCSARSRSCATLLSKDLTLSIAFDVSRMANALSKRTMLACSLNSSSSAALPEAGGSLNPRRK